MGAYFRAMKAASVAVLGSNKKYVFKKDIPTYVEDEGDIYIYRHKDILYECDENGNPLVQGSGPQGANVAAPLSRSVYQGYEGAKRKQIQAENAIRENEEARKQAEANAVEDKKDIDVELSSEDDLDVEDGDFEFEEDKKIVEESKSKKKKPKKKISKDKKIEKKAKVSKKKTKPKKKENKKKKSDGFKKKKGILDRFSE